MKKVFVAMSGGVDSSVAAALLREQGFAVIGVFMKNWTRPIEQAGRLHCPWREDLESAQAAADHLGIPLKIYNFELDYHDKVVNYFYTEYAAGRTPNPDVMCNREIKFGVFLKQALSEGADYIATGHYARVARNNQPSTINNQNFQILRGLDTNKDQSYFLWAVKPEVLRYCLFPIGDYTKPQVRQLARQFGLPNADRKDSQGICFIGPVAVDQFLREKLPVRQGTVRAFSGEAVGRHQGAHFVTIGQRHGVGAATGQPVYVAEKDSTTNTVWVDEDWPGSRLYSRSTLISDLNWFGTLPNEKFQCDVQVRYRQKPVKAVVSSSAGPGSPPLLGSPGVPRLQRAGPPSHSVSASPRLRRGTKPGRILRDALLTRGLATHAMLHISFAEPVRAVTEGQSLVCYNGALLLGGGVIDKHAAK